MDPLSKNLPVAETTQSHNTSLSTFLRTQQQAFSDKLGRDFQTKRRSKDMRLVFQTAVRKKYPSLSVIWLTGKHGNLAKILFTTYSPTQLRAMIEQYIGNEQYHTDKGISFDGFYWSAAKIATDLAAAQTRAEVRSARQKAVTLTDDPPAQDIEKFKRSAFFKRLPSLFKEHLGAKES